jgi:hypothetical protein
MRQVLAAFLFAWCGFGWADCYSDGEDAVNSNRINEAIQHFTTCIEDRFSSETTVFQSRRYRGTLSLSA